MIVGGAAVVIAVGWPASYRAVGRQPARWRWKATRPRLLRPVLVERSVDQLAQAVHDPTQVDRLREPLGPIDAPALVGGAERFCEVEEPVDERDAHHEHDTGLSSARCPALPVGLRADRLEQLEDGIEDVFHTPFVGMLVRCFGGEELVDAAHGRRLRDDL